MKGGLPPDFKGLILGIAIVIFGIGVAIHGRAYFNLRLYQEANAWPSVQATIVKVTPVRNIDAADYEYTYSNVNYRDQILVTVVHKDFVPKWHIGASFDIKLDPAKPTRHIMEDFLSEPFDRSNLRIGLGVWIFGLIVIIPAFLAPIYPSRQAYLEPDEEYLLDDNEIIHYETLTVEEARHIWQTRIASSKKAKNDFISTKPHPSKLAKYIGEFLFWVPIDLMLETTQDNRQQASVPSATLQQFGHFPFSERTVIKSKTNDVIEAIRHFAFGFWLTIPAVGMLYFIDYDSNAPIWGSLSVGVAMVVFSQAIYNKYLQRENQFIPDAVTKEYAIVIRKGHTYQPRSGEKYDSKSFVDLLYMVESTHYVHCLEMCHSHSTYLADTFDIDTKFLRTFPLGSPVELEINSKNPYKASVNLSYFADEADSYASRAIMQFIGGSMLVALGCYLML